MSEFHKNFRLSQREIWQDLAKKIDADFFPGVHHSRDAVQAYHENWTIIIDTYQPDKRPQITRIRAPYLNRDSFQFRILRETRTTLIGKKLGLQDVIIGHREFDEDFVIQGNDENKLRQLFDNDLIRNLIHFQPRMSMEIILDDSWKTQEFGDGFSELIFEVPAVINNIELLHGLYDLFAEVLSHLCDMGSAYEDDPFGES